MHSTSFPIHRVVVGIAALVFAATPAKAAIAVTSNSAGNIVGLSFSLGYVFTVSTSQSLTALGQFDIVGDGASATAKVALFNWDTGAKLAETTLAGAVFEETGFYDTHFVTIAPVSLTPGTNYLVAAEVNANDFVYGTGIMAIDPAITWVEGRATGVGAPAMPATADGTTFSIQRGVDQCYFGPNMKVIPEPAALALLGIGGFALSLRRRRA